MKVKKVALMCDFFSSLGGTEYYNFTLAKKLTERQIEVKIFIGERPRYYYWIEKLDECNISYCYPDELTDDLRKREIEKKFIDQVKVELDEWKPDIMHYNPPGKMLVSWMEKYSDSEIPVVATEWTMPCNNTAHWYPAELKEYINYVDVYIATCQTLVKGIQDYHLYDGRIEVVPHLVTKPKDHLSKTENLYSVGYIGRLSAEKGLDFLLGAWTKIVKKYSQAELHIYGHGGEEAHYHSLINALGLRKNVFLEDVYEPAGGIEKIAYQHEIYVQPSLFESIPTTVIELMGRGRIVVATDVGGMKELISNEKKTGILIQRASTEEIFQALDTLFQNKELRQEMHRKAPEMFYEIYDIQKIINQIITIYDSIINI